MGLFLLFKGIFDITVAFITKEQFELWWLQLVIGLIEIMLAFWVAGNFRKEGDPARRLRRDHRARPRDQRDLRRLQAQGPAAAPRGSLTLPRDSRPCGVYRIAPMRRTALLFVLLVGGARCRRCRMWRRAGAVRDARDRRGRARRPRPRRRRRPRPRHETETTGTETTETETTETGDDARARGRSGRRQGGLLGASACDGCHTLADAGATGTVGPNLDDAKPSCRARHRPRDERPGRHAVLLELAHRAADRRRRGVRLVGRRQVAPAFLDSLS